MDRKYPQTGWRYKNGTAVPGQHREPGQKSRDVRHISAPVRNAEPTRTHHVWPVGAVV
eukprot:SAG11_NODE_19879_length_457_cov_0.860335_1_plen_57_part_10